MRNHVLASGIALFSLCAAAGMAQDRSGGAALKETVDSTIAIDRGAQELREKWASERGDLIARRKTAAAALEFLSPRKAAAEERLAGIETAIAGLQRNMEESKRLEASLVDTLNNIYIRLENRVHTGLPFLSREREGRLVSLKKDLNEPALSGAEKLRRLLEALQVETGYGNGVEVTQERIALGSDSLFVDLLRVGRVSLYWRTTDGERIGEYDRGMNRWIELPGNFKRDLGLAMEMATRMRPVEIITLPVGRIRP
jgi:hypothetical protein